MASRPASSPDRLACADLPSGACPVIDSESGAIIWYVSPDTLKVAGDTSKELAIALSKPIADLYETVMRLGGRYFCARSMGVLFEARREQRGNWDLSGIRAMLVLHLGLNGDVDIADQNIEMPRSTALMRARRWRIWAA